MTIIPWQIINEWEKRDVGKQPYRYRRRDLEPFAFAGICELAHVSGKDILSAAIIVGEANSFSECARSYACHAHV
jgi:putative SOS response-associated peptidase YedK